MGSIRRHRRKTSRSIFSLAAPESLEPRLALRTPNDTYMKPPYRQNDPPNPQWNMEKIQALAAWDEFQGERRGIVAVMDYGLDFDHEDFASSLNGTNGNLWQRGPLFAAKFYANRGYDEINGPYPPTRPQLPAATKPAVGEFLGNHAAGIIAAMGNNTKGVAGVNWEAQLFSSKIIDGGKTPTLDVIKRAIDHFIEMRTETRDEQLIRAVAFGWSTEQNFGNPMPQFRRLVQAPLTEETGILVTIPAGDNGMSLRPSYPAAYAPEENVLVVGATDRNDQIMPWNSNRPLIDIYAPGDDIMSLGDAKSAYRIEDGTRQAAAHVAGAIALVYAAARARNQDLTWRLVKEAILEGADIIAGGAKRLNVANSLRYLALLDDAPPPPPPPEPPPDGPPKVALSGGRIEEGNAGQKQAVFTVSLDRTFTSATTFKCRVADGTATLADQDYLPFGANGLWSVTIPAGQKAATFSVLVQGDQRFEADETIKASLVDVPSKFEVTAGTAEFTIANDEPLPQIALRPRTDVPETTGSPRVAQVFATLTLPSASIVRVSVRAVPGTATENADYVLPAISQQLVFAPGQVSQALRLRVVGDAVPELTESLTLELFDPVNATLASPSSGVVVIKDDDMAVIGGVSEVRRAVTYATTMTFRISLARPAAAPVEVSYTPLDGTAANGVDYTLAAGTLAFARGEWTKTITVSVAPRRAGTAYPKRFVLRLSNAKGGVLSSESALLDLTGTIV